MHTFSCRIELRDDLRLDSFGTLEIQNGLGTDFFSVAERELLLNPGNRPIFRKTPLLPPDFLLLLGTEKPLHPFGNLSLRQNGDQAPKNRVQDGEMRSDEEEVPREKFDE